MKKKILITIILLIIGTPMIKAETINNGEVIIPIGSIQSYGGSNLPEGYLEANGQAISRTTYSKLFEVYKTTYGAGDGKTTFNLPNLNGKVIVGQNSSESEFNTLGKTGGAKAFNNSHTHKVASHTHTTSAVTLTEAQLPKHTHSISSQTVTTSEVAAHSHNIPTLNGTAISSGVHTHSFDYYSNGERSSNSGYIYGSNTAGSAWNLFLGKSTTSTSRTLARLTNEGAHTHDVTIEANTTGSNGKHTHSVTIPATTSDFVGSGEAHSHGDTGGSGELTTSSSGSASQSLLQPYIVLKYIIKVK